MATARTGGAASRGGGAQGEGPRGSTPYFDALKTLKESPFSHAVWMLDGGDPYLYDRFSQALLEGVVPDLREFNLAVVHCVYKPEEAARACLVKALGEMEELPIGAPHRLVMVRDVHNLPEAGLVRLAEFLPHLPPTTVVLLSGHHSQVPASSGGKATEDATGKGEGPQGGAKAYRRLMEVAAASGGLVNGALSADVTKWNGDWLPGERTQWVKRVVRDLQLVMGDDMLRLFVERVGDDMYTLLHEAQKLACFKHGGNREVTAEDLRAVVCANPTHQIWDLSDAIARRNAAGALQVISEMLGFGKGDDEVFPLLGYLGSHFRNLVRVKTLQARGTPAGEAMRILKARSEWKLKREMELVSRMSEADLEKALDSLLRADHAIKRGMSGRLALEMAVVGLCEPGGVTP